MAIYKKKDNLSKKVFEFIKIMAAKAGFVGSLYLGALYHDPILRITDRLIYGSIPVQKEFFQDPYGLRIKHDTNRYGRMESYLVYHNEFMIPLTYENLESLEKKVEEDVCVTTRRTRRLTLQR